MEKINRLIVLDCENGNCNIYKLSGNETEEEINEIIEENGHSINNIEYMTTNQENIIFND